MRRILFAMATASIVGAVAWTVPLIRLSNRPSAMAREASFPVAWQASTLDDPICEPEVVSACDSPQSALALLAHLRAAGLAHASPPARAARTHTVPGTTEAVGRRATIALPPTTLDAPGAMPLLDKEAAAPDFRVPMQIDLATVLRDRLVGSRSAFSTCYERALRHDQKMAGRVLLEVAVEPDGQVVSARVVESTVRDDEVLGCIAKRVRQMHLPALGEEVEVQVPLALVARED